MILEILQKLKINKTGIWFMRQAGRYLPEYKELRKKSGTFLETCYNSDLICEITLQPLKRFDLDAAIIFSDILVLHDLLGFDVNFIENEGPILEFDFDFFSIRKNEIDFSNKKIQSVYNGIKETRKNLDPKKTLIGFVGAPWTLICYAIEKKSSKDFKKTKIFSYDKKLEFQHLIDVFIYVCKKHLCNQIDAGVDVVQIFDSWSNVLDEEDYRKWVFLPFLEICKEIRLKYPTVPIIWFPRASFSHYGLLIKQNEGNFLNLFNCLSVDYSTSTQLSKSFGGLIAIWFYQIWKQYFYLKKITIIELGPGNGNLILTMIKIFMQIPEFFDKISIILIENSKYLKKLQQEKLTFLTQICEKKINWFTDLGLCEINSPIFFISNEFFDCLPINQFFYQKNFLYEILINFNEKNNKFSYCLSKKLSNSQYLINKNYLINNKIIEISTSAINICKYINYLLKKFSGISLIFDYGYSQFFGKSSIQGIYKHKISNIFDNIGYSDISAHVNFLDLEKEFTDCINAIYTQKEFLIKLKIDKLGNIVDNSIYDDSEYKSIGKLFKVLYSKNINF